MNQTLRRQQDEAYLESLQADQEKERRKQKEQQLREQAEEESRRLQLEEKQKEEVRTYLHCYSRLVFFTC